MVTIESLFAIGYVLKYMLVVFSSQPFYIYTDFLVRGCFYAEGRAIENSVRVPPDKVNAWNFRDKLKAICLPE